jgi:APA family basic amino acid/polyamine antiporter
MSFWSRRKPIVDTREAAEGSGLRRTLGWPQLVGLGVGAIVGTGIYTLIGVGAERAGPAVLLAFVVAGVVCVCAALAYAELATAIPASGAAYTYSYSVLGEGVAWFVGWALILEYSVVCSAVAVGWSGYAAGFLNSAGIHLPAALLAGPHAGGLINLPAVAIIAVVASLLLAGTRESVTFNAFLVAFKIVALAAFVALALPAFKAGNFHPFMPYGFPAHVMPDGEVRGVMAAAAIIFFAFYGFDAVATAAEEAKDPKRDLTIGIIGSMVACTIIYMLVALAAVGAVPFGDFAKSTEPLAYVLRTLGHSGVAVLIGAAAVIALPTVILAFMYGQTRIFFVMARDGLLPRRFGKVSKAGTPVAVTIGTAVIVAVLAGLLPLNEIAELANAGTLIAFIAVGVCLMVLRKTQPDLPRVFRTPLPWVVGPVAVLGCMYLFYSLPGVTQLRFVIWSVLGVVVYLLYGRRNSVLAKG